MQSQRAYQLPSWFFVLAAVLSILAFVAVGWVFLGDRFDQSGGPQATASAPATASEREPEPEPTPTTSEPTSTRDDAGEGRRSGIDVVVLNASERPGLAADVADAAREAGWTVADVGNWIYPAHINAVYYPEGRQSEAQLLAEDVDIAGVRPARPGMSADDLTILLVGSP